MSISTCDVTEKVYVGDTGGALYDGQQQVLYWADVSTELAFVVPSPTSHALAAGKAWKCRYCLSLYCVTHCTQAQCMHSVYLSTNCFKASDTHSRNRLHKSAS